MRSREATRANATLPSLLASASTTDSRLLAMAAALVAASSRFHSVRPLARLDSCDREEAQVEAKLCEVLQRMVANHRVLARPDEPTDDDHPHVALVCQGARDAQAGSRDRQAVDAPKAARERESGRAGIEHKGLPTVYEACGSGGDLLLGFDAEFRPRTERRLVAPRLHAHGAAADALDRAEPIELIEVPPYRHGRDTRPAADLGDRHLAAGG